MGTKKESKTSTPRSQEFRERMKKAGLHEVRGIYAPKHKHADIKAVAAEILGKGKKK